MTNDLLDRYLEVNSRFGRPFVLKLTQRGFYSEVNNLLNAMIFGLAKRRRLIVDESDFEGLRWSDFFTSTLPIASLDVVARVPDRWIIDGIRSYRFWRIYRFVIERHRWHFPLWIPSMRLFGGIQSIKRSLAEMLFTPRTKPDLPATPYAGFHIRRGDKIEGGRLAEGEDVSPQAYMELLRTIAPDVRSIFVMTDDYTSIETLRAIAPEYNIMTRCTPEERGYRQPAHSSQAVSLKAERLHRLIAETQIAAASAFFIGGFKSNVSRFVVLRHNNPERCFSVDSEKSWNPG